MGLYTQARASRGCGCCGRLRFQEPPSCPQISPTTTRYKQ